MNKYEMVAFIVFVTTAGATISSVARAWLRRLEIKSQQSTRSPALDDERLDRIERAVEAVAIEVERISEGQRFTTKLLADRNNGGAANGSLPASGAAGLAGGRRGAE